MSGRLELEELRCGSLCRFSLKLGKPPLLLQTRRSDFLKKLLCGLPILRLSSRSIFSAFKGTPRLRNFATCALCCALLLQHLALQLIYFGTKLSSRVGWWARRTEGTGVEACVAENGPAEPDSDLTRHLQRGQRVSRRALVFMDRGVPDLTEVVEQICYIPREKALVAQQPKQFLKSHPWWEWDTGPSGHLFGDQLGKLARFTDARRRVQMEEVLREFAEPGKLRVDLSQIVEVSVHPSTGASIRLTMRDRSELVQYSRCTKPKNLGLVSGTSRWYKGRHSGPA